MHLTIAQNSALMEQMLFIPPLWISMRSVVRYMPLHPIMMSILSMDIVFNLAEDDDGNVYTTSMAVATGSGS